MAYPVETEKKIAILHRYPEEQIPQTNAAFPYIAYNQDIYWKISDDDDAHKRCDALTFKTFNRLNQWQRILKSVLWIFYAPMLVIGRGYDVIYCDDSFPYYSALVKLVSPRSKVIKRMGDFHLMYYLKGWVYDFFHLFETWEWEVIDGIFAISEPMADEIEWKVGYRPVVINDPVDLEAFHPKEKHTDRGFSDGVRFHGFLTKNKGIDTLLRAARLLPAVKFVIGGDGPDKKRLESIAPANVHFEGWQEDIGTFIRWAKIGIAIRGKNPGNQFVVTSPYLQYGACGKPCIVSKRKVFGDYEWQFTDAKDLAEKIERLMPIATEEGEKLRKHIVENHDARKIGEEIWYRLSS